MQKYDVFEDLIDFLIRKAIEDEDDEKHSKIGFSSRIVKGENSDGLYPSSGIRKQA